MRRQQKGGKERGKKRKTMIQKGKIAKERRTMRTGEKRAKQKKTRKRTVEIEREGTVRKAINN